MALRVHDLARELKISSAALMKHLKDMSIEVKSHMKYLDDDIAEKVREKFRQGVEQIKKLETERRMIQEQLRTKEKKEKEIKAQIVDNPFKDMSIPQKETPTVSPFVDIPKSEKSETAANTREDTEKKNERAGFRGQRKEIVDGKIETKTDKPERRGDRRERREPREYRSESTETGKNINDAREFRPDRKSERPERRDQRHQRGEGREQRSDRVGDRGQRTDTRGDRPDRPDNREQRPDRRSDRPDRPDNREQGHDRRGDRPDRPDNREQGHDRRSDRPDRSDNREQRPDRRGDRQHRTQNTDNRSQRRGDWQDRSQARNQSQDTREYRPEKRGDRPFRPDNREQRPAGRGDRGDRPDRPESRFPRPENRDGWQDRRRDRLDRPDNREQRTDATSTSNRRLDRPEQRDGRIRQRNDNFENRRQSTSTEKFTPKPLFPKAGIVKPETKDFVDKQFGKEKVKVDDLGDKSKHIQAKLKNTKKRKKVGDLPEVDEATLEKNIKQTLSSTKKMKKYKKEEKRSEDIDDVSAVSISEYTSVSELAKIIDVSPSEIITKFFQMGKMVSINQRLDKDSLELICAEYDLEIHFQDEFGADLIQDKIAILGDIIEKPRPPVVTIMGHVDHGKTSILDRIRNTKVAHGESGGITQHIGAYQAVHNDQKVTFIDTPGHEAFTAMRARGANITDVAVIVVAANDGVKPQTIEAIDHSRAAGVTMIVAINKIDLPDANIDKTIASLLEQNVFLEGYGGQVPWVKCSAIKGDGIDELLEIILLSAEMKELKARINGPGKGIVLESEKNTKVGSKATVLLQEGVLKKGDNIVVGSSFGNVRKMENELTMEVMSIYPADIAVVYGLNNVPKAGDILNVVESEKVARQIGGERLLIRQEREKYQSKTNLGNLFTKIRQNEMTDLRLIVKADFDGSVEAVCDSLQKLSTDEIKITIIRKSVGGVIEADVNLASASDAIIIGFNVRANNKAKKLAEETGVEMKFYQIIFEAIDDIRKAMIGMLSPEFKDKILGHALVKQVFKIKKLGTIAGCAVEKGIMQSKSKIRLYRDDKVIFTGDMDSLRHYQDEVKEAISGTECGISIKNYNDIKEGDIIECYILEEIERQL